MKIFTASAVKEIDGYTIAHEPIASIDLMERAASKLLNWYVYHYKVNRRVMVFAGPGNNGGDAMAMARKLAGRKFNVQCYLVSVSGKLSANCETNYIRLKEQGLVSIVKIIKEEDFPDIDNTDVVIDGLFGSGLTRLVEGIYKELIKHLNASFASVVSIDIPSGLFGEDNSENHAESIIKADYTLTFQFPFASFLFAENATYTGQWKVLDIGLNTDIIDKLETPYFMLSRRWISELIPQRDKFSHKGTYGHALIIAGSYGMMGAAVLTGKAALRSGAGLVTVHIPGSGYTIMQTAVAEAIVSIDHSNQNFTEIPDLNKYRAIAIGPGLGVHAKSAEGLKNLLINAEVPLVIDADALNMIAADKKLLQLLPSGSILTPHPGEFDRLLGDSDSTWTRHKKQIDFSIKHNVIVILKGAFTGISFPDGSYVFNTTGNPGMATGGSGDVLSGIVVSLLAQGMSPKDAAVVAVFLHGWAGDIAVENESQESLIAGDIINQLGEAFKRVKVKPFLHEGRTGIINQ